MTDPAMLNPTQLHQDLLITYVRRFVQAALLFLIVWLLVTIVANAMSHSLSFDGAMNLLMSRSIATGDGPREVYDSHDLFPPGVQTKVPFVLLGALIFKLFGVGQLQTQLPNLIYLGLLCAVLLLTMRRIFGTSASMLAIVMLLASPHIAQYGLSGYGELPTLFFGLAGLVVVAWPGPWQAQMLRRCFLAGALVGLALATKVVGVVQVAMVGTVLLCRLSMEKDGTWRKSAQGCSLFAAGLAAPLLMVELWHLLHMGISGYRAWWKFMWSSIMSQSGATPPDPQGMLSTKIAHHFQIISTEVGLGHIAMMAAIVLPLAAIGVAYFSAYNHEQRARSKWFLLGLVLLVVLYFPWWLAIVPNNKAWLRYIYIGLISLELIAALSIVANIQGTLSNKRVPVRLAHLGLAIVVLGIYGPLTIKAARTPIPLERSEDALRDKQAAKLISRLPDSAEVLGYGWYAAPQIQIYTKRPFMDLTDWPIGDLVNKSAYVVADRATIVTGILNGLFLRYPHRALMPANSFAQVYQVDFSNPENPFLNQDTAHSLSKVDFSTVNYPLTIGMEPFDPIGGRFIESDSEIMLRYNGQSSFELRGYMDAAVPSYYRWPTPLAGRVLIDNCPPLSFKFAKPGWETFQMHLACKLSPDKNVRVRILLDNVMDLPLLRDRQRAMLLANIGFGNDDDASSQ